MTGEPDDAIGNHGPVTDPVDEAFTEAIAQLGANGRDSLGRFAPGNTAAAVTYQRSRQFWAVVEAAKRDHVDELCRDLGFGRDTPRAVRRIAEAQVEMSLKREHYWYRLAESEGPTTQDGRTKRLAHDHGEAAQQELEMFRKLVTLPKTRDGRPVGHGETFDAALSQAEAAR